MRGIWKYVSALCFTLSAVLAVLALLPICDGQTEIYYGCCGCELYNAPSCWGSDTSCSGSHCTNPGGICETAKKDYHELKNCREPGEEGEGCQNEHSAACYTTFDCKCRRIFGPDNDTCDSKTNFQTQNVTIKDCV